VGFLSRRARALAHHAALFASAALLAITPPAWAVERGAPEPTPAQPVPHEFRDDLGHRYAPVAPPRRIISLSPNLTEILFAMDCDSLEIAGVTRFCDYPPEARLLPQVGGIVDPSLEAVLLLKPDLVLATRGNPLEFMESLIALGIPVYALDDRGDLASIPRIVARLRPLLRCEREAFALERALDGRLEAVRALTAPLEGGARPRVYFGELEGAHWTAGPGSHIDGLITVAGGTNIAARSPAAWCPLSVEEIVSRDPQVYFGTFAGADTPEQRAAAEERTLRFLREDEVWRRTALGRDPRVFLVQEDRVLRPGPRVFDVLEEFARFLHPELFGGE
jgi:iron complex transport system substrate-binding protein